MGNTLKLESVSNFQVEQKFKKQIQK